MPPFVNDLLLRHGRTRALITVLVAVAGAAALWGIGNWASSPQWVPLYTDLPLDAAGQINDKLGEAGIARRLGRGGTALEVGEKDLARARVVLAQAGLPTRGRPGFELFDQPAWGMTDFTQRINYRRALEGELERSISQMRGIEGAQVHIALREGSSLRRAERPIEASVLLRLRAGAALPPEQVEAITFLIANSVEGLGTDHISVVDDAGRVLSAALQPGGGGSGTTKRHVSLQRETESYLERRAEDLLIDVVGSGNARVRVAASLNFDRLDRTSLQLDPESQVVLREERSDIVPGTKEQGAASTVANQMFDVSRTTETLSTEPGGVRRLTVAVLVNEATLSGNATQQAMMLTRIESLVRNAVGLDDGRGDAISVVSARFEERAPAPLDAPPSVPLPQRIVEYSRPGLGLLALLLGFVVVLQAVRAVRPLAKTASAPLATLHAGSPAQPVLAPQETPAALREREQLAAIVSQRPDNASRVIRAWMKDA